MGDTTLRVRCDLVHYGLCSCIRGFTVVAFLNVRVMDEPRTLLTVNDRKAPSGRRSLFVAGCDAPYVLQCASSQWLDEFAYYQKDIFAFQQA